MEVLFANEIASVSHLSGDSKLSPSNSDSNPQVQSENWQNRDQRDSKPNRFFSKILQNSNFDQISGARTEKEEKHGDNLIQQGKIPVYSGFLAQKSAF